MNITIDLGQDKDVLDLLVPAVESQLQEAEFRLEQAENEVNQLRDKLKRVRSKVEAVTSSAVNPQRAPSGRMRKGESERIILNFLKNRNGTGATLKEIMGATGASYGTARRILLTHAAAGELTELGNKYTWVANQNGTDEK